MAELTKNQQSAIALIEKVNSLKSELDAQIRAFDSALNHTLHCDFENGLSAVRIKAQEEGDFRTLERLAKIEQFYAMWATLSNGIRGLL